MKHDSFTENMQHHSQVLKTVFPWTCSLNLPCGEMQKSQEKKEKKRLNV